MVYRYDVCLSYSEADSDFASRLRGDLAAKGLTVWEVRWHATTPSSFSTIIEQGAAAARVTVLVMSPDHCGPMPSTSAAYPEVRGLSRVILALRRDCDVPEGLRSNPSVDFRNEVSYGAGLQNLDSEMASHLEDAASAIAFGRSLRQGLSVGVWILLAALLSLLGSDGLISPALAIVASIVAIGGVQLGVSRGWPSPVAGLAVLLVGAPVLMLTYQLLYKEAWSEASVFSWAFMTPLALSAWLLSYARSRIATPWSLAFLAGAAVLVLHPIAWFSGFVAYCLVWSWPVSVDGFGLGI